MKCVIDNHDIVVEKSDIDGIFTAMVLRNKEIKAYGTSVEEALENLTVFIDIIPEIDDWSEQEDCA